MNLQSVIRWAEAGEEHSLPWRSESGNPPPKRVVIADDTMNADAAYRLACEGTALLWRGDFQNAKQLLQAMARRVERRSRKAKDKPVSMAEAFHLHRLAQSQKARTLGMLLVPVEDEYRIPLRRAPDMRQPCEEVYGLAGGPFAISLRELLGLIGAHEWRKKGAQVPALGDRIHPYYGVFSPVRGEYVQLVADAPLPSTELAFDIGTGTGVLSAVLARRGIRKVIATDQDARALQCARDNIARLELEGHVEILEMDMFPEGRAPLVVCNPPWIPARPSSALERAIYDPESRMLKAFLDGLSAHLAPDGEGWLILSDIAEHLGLRTRDELLDLVTKAGLKVVDRMDTRPQHPKAMDESDPLHAARKAEVTSLWRLKAA